MRRAPPRQRKMPQISWEIRPVQMTNNYSMMGVTIHDDRQSGNLRVREIPSHHCACTAQESKWRCSHPSHADRHKVLLPVLIGLHQHRNWIWAIWCRRPERMRLMRNTFAQRLAILPAQRQGFETAAGGIIETQRLPRLRLERCRWRWPRPRLGRRIGLGRGHRNGLGSKRWGGKLHDVRPVLANGLRARRLKSGRDVWRHPCPRGGLLCVKPLGYDRSWRSSLVAGTGPFCGEACDSVCSRPAALPNEARSSVQARDRPSPTSLAPWRSGSERSHT